MTTGHGGNIIATAKKLGCQPSELIDMSSNLSPLGPAPGLRDVLISALDQIGYLPETDSETLVETFAAHHGLTPRQVLAGNGTTEFIFDFPCAVAKQRAVIVTPTYADYLQACNMAAVQASAVTLRRQDDFRLDLKRLAAELKGDELVFLCNPNNPTGVLCPTSDLHDFIQQHPKSIFLVDESYLPFVNEPSLLDLPMPANLCVLRSFSKIYGIPGLRLGFLAGSEAVIAEIRARRRPWGVNRLAQVAGEYLIRKAARHVESVVQFVEKQRPLFTAALHDLPGIQAIPGSANFILGYLRGGLMASQLQEALLPARIMIRNCANFAGLDDRYFRLSLKTEEENRLCLRALTNIIQVGLR